MAPIRTFDFAWPAGPRPDGTSTVRNIQCALGGGGGGRHWVLIRTSPPEDEYEPYEWCGISTSCEADRSPAPSPAGNKTFYIKNYSENTGLLDRLEGVGMVRRTGRVEPQGFVQLPLVEVLVPEEEMIRSCGACGCWEELEAPRFKKCNRCKVLYYCSVKCQTEDWKAGHKGLCRAGLTEDEVFGMEKAKTGNMLQQMGFKTMNLGSG